MFCRLSLPRVFAAILGTLALAAPAAAQMTPVALSGFNRDIVVENTAVVPYADFAMSFDTFNGWSWYERSLPGSTKGLPEGGTFTSLADGTRGQFAPYDQPNALFLDAGAPTGALMFAPAAQVAYDQLAIFASSSNGGGLGTLVITFTDSSTSGAINFNAQDWFFVTTNNALNNLGRISLTTNTIDDASAGNPRIYQTTLDLRALGLNDRAVASITFTKPAGGGSQNTVVMAISGLPVLSALLPVPATGFNRDIVVENTASAPYSGFAQSFDVGGNFSWYENALPGSVKGLPQGGGFTSLAHPAIQAQFEPYDAPNALHLNTAIGSASGTLTLAPAAQIAYDYVAVFASSAGGGGVGTVVVHFADFSTSGPLPFNAQDWFNVTTNNALNYLGRMNLNTSVADDGSANNPRIYQTVLNLAGLGLNDRAVAALEFTKPAASQSTVVMALSGQPTGIIGGCVMGDGTCLLTTEGACTGMYLGDGSSCPPSGACIAGNGDCTVRTQANCMFVGGTFQGAGVPCPGAGACLAANGDCTQLNSFQCAFQGGSFQGAGAPCPQTGACCAPGGCVLVNTFQCAFQGGTFQGEGTGCDAGPEVGSSLAFEPIVDNATFSDSIFVSDTTPLDAMFITMNLNHTFIGDLIVTITFTPDVGPVIGPIDVFNRVRQLGGAGFGSPSNLIDTGDYVFGDGGADLWAALVTNPTNVPPGFYSPSTNDGSATSPPNGAFTSFAPFVGLSPAGTWTLTVSDNAPSDVGTLNSWSINRGQCPDTPSAGACCIGATCMVLTAAECVGANTSYSGNGTACNAPGNNTTPCCRADFDHSGTVAVPDIFAFLSAWFAGHPSANADGMGGITVPDIFAFLSLWFAGCP